MANRKPTRLLLEKLKKRELTNLFEDTLQKQEQGFKKSVREFKVEDLSAYSLAQEIKVDVFEAGEKVDAISRNFKR